MTSAQHEALITKYELLMLEADNREDRMSFATAFLLAIAERNAMRTTNELIAIEKARGLR